MSGSRIGLVTAALAVIAIAALRAQTSPTAAFKHSGYARTAYDDGNGGIPFVIDTIRVRVNAAAALGRVEHAHEHRYADLSTDDALVLEKTPLVTHPADRTSLASGSSPPSSRRFAFSSTENLEMKFGKVEPTYTESALRKVLDRVRTPTVPSDPADANVDRVNSASASDSSQEAGGSALQYVEETLVISEGSRAPSLPWAGAPARGLAALKATLRPASLPTIRQSTASGAPAVKAIFVATGRSSGAAFQMTMAYNGPGPLELVDPGFVLEPVQGVSASQAEREMAGVKGRRVTATIDAYCLQMRKPPPAAGMVYRLAKNAVQQRHPQLAPIMIASKVLKDAGQLHPDSDPAQYFHSVRQWALWAFEQKFTDEAAFADAFVEHSRKNVTGAGRKWTPELEQGVRRLLPNRWRDITEVMKLAGLGSTMSK